MKTNSDIKIGGRTKLASAWIDVEASRRGKGGANVNSSEYDFSSVPEDEIEASVYYEYARESAQFVSQVYGLRRVIRKWKDSGAKECRLSRRPTKITERSSAPMHGAGISMALAEQDGYPAVAGQELKADDRQILKGSPGQAVVMHNEQLEKEHPSFVARVEPTAYAVPIRIVMDSLIALVSFGDSAHRQWLASIR